jgi:spore coat polysaccharide biosynthesis protein SpsF
VRKLVACLACRNQGTRLYGKPLQNLSIEKKLTVLQYMVESIRSYNAVTDMVLGICEGNDNIVFEDFAKRNGVEFIVGSEEDVLQRLIQCCEKVTGTDIFRLTTESPFTYFEAIDKAWEQHVKKDHDLTALDQLPDGSGFEMIKLEAYKSSWEHGENKHRSELCSLYIRENKKDFNIGYVDIPQEVKRTDIRLTIDYPEDLVLCRAVYKEFEHLAPLIPLKKIINFVDANPQLQDLVKPFIEEGLKTMYL